MKSLSVRGTECTASIAAGAAGALGARLSAGPHDVDRADRRDFVGSYRVDRARSSRLRPQPRPEHRASRPLCERCGAETPRASLSKSERRRPCAPFTMDQFADDLAALLDALGIASRWCIAGCRWADTSPSSSGGNMPSDCGGWCFATRASTADTPEAAAGRHVMAERVLAEGPGFAGRDDAAAAVLRDDAATAAGTGRGVAARDHGQFALSGIAAAALGMAERPDMTAALGGDSLPHAGRRRPGRRDLYAGGDARHCRGDSRREVRRDSRRRPHVAAGEPRRGERRDRRVSGGIVATLANGKKFPPAILRSASFFAGFFMLSSSAFASRQNYRSRWGIDKLCVSHRTRAGEGGLTSMARSPMLMVVHLR